MPVGTDASADLDVSRLEPERTGAAGAEVGVGNPEATTEMDLSICLLTLLLQSVPLVIVAETCLVSSD